MAMNPSEIDGQVARIAVSRTLHSSASLVRLLQFIVSETQAGRANELKEYTLGTEVLGRGAEFDPRVDTIVRVQARRLRAKLREYYEAEGKDDPVVIRLERGSYVPRFEARPVGPDPAVAAASRLRRGWATVGLVALIAAVGGLLWFGVARPTVASQAAANGHIANPEAHALYLQAKAAYAKGTREGLSESVTLFQKATRADASYVPAYTGLAYAYLFQSSNFLPPSDAMPKARDAARAALALDQANIEAHTALGQVALFYEWDLDAAQASARRAFALNPYSSAAHELQSQILTARARFDEAQKEIERAQEADPLSVTLAYDAGWNLIYARRYGEAAEACRRALEHDPNFDLARGLRGLALVLDGRTADGLPELERAASHADSSVVDLLLVHGYAFAGRTDDARALLDRVTESARTRYVCAYEVGSAHAALANLEAAFSWFERAIRERSDCVVWLRVEPWLDRLRADTRYASLTRGITSPGGVTPPKAAQTVAAR